MMTWHAKLETRWLEVYRDPRKMAWSIRGTARQDPSKGQGELMEAHYIREDTKDDIWSQGLMCN